MDPMRGAETRERSQTGDAAGAQPRSDTSRSTFKYILVALGLALFIRFFIVAPYIVEGASMEPTFSDWQYLIIDKLAYRINEPRRGDVIVFELPGNTGRSLIKRVIGLPGETVRIEGSTVTIENAAHPDGFALNEPYIDPKNASANEHLETTLGPGEYFVLGDNRHVSADSRLWGHLPKSDIAGRVDARLFPLGVIGILPGEARYLENQ